MTPETYNRTVIGDCRETLRGIPDQTFHCCVTSPPYIPVVRRQAQGRGGGDVALTLLNALGWYEAELVALLGVP